MENNFPISDNFYLSEFECTSKDHHHVIVDDLLLEKVQKLRSYWNVPISFNSAYRCPQRNEEVGGSEHSYHMLGMAVDIPLRHFPVDIDAVVESALMIGFTGIGKYDNFVHLDVRPGPLVIFDERS